jgi:DNA-binding transcriptional MerR regulator
MPDKTMRIGRFAGCAGVNAKTIRYYEQIGLLPAPKRAGNGYRVYGEEDLGRLTFIRAARRLGLSLDSIREILAFRDRGKQPCGYVVAAVQREMAMLDQRIRELRALRTELGQLLARTEQVTDQPMDYCALIEAQRPR